MMALLIPVFTVVDPKPPYPPASSSLADHWDMPIWAASKESGAQYVISENTHDFPPRQADDRHVFEGIEYMTVDAFVAMLTGDVDETPDEEPRWSSLFPGGIMPDLVEQETPED
jgi:hypothetical protein